MEEALKNGGSFFHKLNFAWKTLCGDIDAIQDRMVTALVAKRSARAIIDNWLIYSTIASLFLGEMLFHKGVDIFRGYPIVVMNAGILLLRNRLLIHRNHAIFVAAVMFISLVAGRFSGTSGLAVVAQIIGILVFSVYYFSMLTTFGVSMPRWLSLYSRAALLIAIWGIIDYFARRMGIFPQTVQTRLHSILPEPSFYVYLTLPAIGIYLNAHLRRGGYRLELAIFFISYILADSSLGFLGLFFVAYFAFLPRLNIWRMMGFGLLAVAAFTGLFFASGNFRLRVVDTAQSIILLNLQHANASTYAVLSNVYVTGMTFIHHPVAGVGIGGYANAYSQLINSPALANDDPEAAGFNMYDASSLFLRTAAELGIFGVVALFGFLIVCARVRGDQHVEIRNALVPFMIMRMGRYGAYFSMDFFFFVGIYFLNYMHYRDQIKRDRLAIAEAEPDAV